VVKLFFNAQDEYRLEHLKQVLKSDDVYPDTQLMPKLEEDWCSFHNLYQSSLHQVSEICTYLYYVSEYVHFWIYFFKWKCITSL
jgi:hypothetical protein